jgi:hypothetical protein
MVWERLDEVVRAEGNRLEADVVVPVPLHWQRESAGLQPGGPFRLVAGTAAGTSLPAGAAETRQAQAGETFASAGRKLGGGTWRFCHGKWRVGLTIPESCC